MKKLLTNFTFLINLILVSALWVSATHVFATTQEAGQVLMVKGPSSAKGDDGKSRDLIRRSPVFVGDVLQTGKDGQLQVRMKDGAMIALGADSEFIIKSYSYQKAGDAKDGAVLSLVKGSLRTISGQIEKSSYKLQTPVATLGIRGTEFDVVVKVNGETVVVIRHGVVYVSDEKDIATKILMIPGLATIVERNQPPTNPAKPPQEILDILGDFLPFDNGVGQSGDVTWQQVDDKSDSDDGGSDPLRDSFRNEILQGAADNAFDQVANQTDAIDDTTNDQATSVPSTPEPGVTPTPAPETSPSPTPTRRPTITPSPAPNS